MTRLSIGTLIYLLPAVVVAQTFEFKGIALGTPTPTAAIEQKLGIKCRAPEGNQACSGDFIEKDRVKRNIDPSHAPMLTDIIGGHVMLAFDSTQATLPHIKAGKLKARGIAAEKRSPIAPDIPTVLEAGGPAMVVSSWYGLLAPAGTPRDIVMKLHAEAAKAVAAPDLRERYQVAGLEPMGSTPDQFAAAIREDYARWAKVVRAANICAE